MSYKKRIAQADEKNEKIFVVKRARLRAKADLIAVEEQLSEIDQKLDKSRSKEKEYSLTEVGALIIDQVELIQLLRVMEEEYKAEFAEEEA